MPPWTRSLWLADSDDEDAVYVNGRQISFPLNFSGSRALLCPHVRNQQSCPGGCYTFASEDPGFNDCSNQWCPGHRSRLPIGCFGIDGLIPRRSSLWVFDPVVLVWDTPALAAPPAWLGAPAAASGVVVNNIGFNGNAGPRQRMGALPDANDDNYRGRNTRLEGPAARRVLEASSTTTDTNTYANANNNQNQLVRRQDTAFGPSRDATGNAGAVVPAPPVASASPTTVAPSSRALSLLEQGVDDRLSHAEAQAELRSKQAEARERIAAQKLEARLQAQVEETERALQAERARAREKEEEERRAGRAFEEGLVKRGRERAGRQGEERAEQERKLRKLEAEGERVGVENERGAGMRREGLWWESVEEEKKRRARGEGGAGQRASGQRFLPKPQSQPQPSRYTSASSKPLYGQPGPLRQLYSSPPPAMASQRQPLPQGRVLGEVEGSEYGGSSTRASHNATPGPAYRGSYASDSDDAPRKKGRASRKYSSSSSSSDDDDDDEELGPPPPPPLSPVQKKRAWAGDVVGGQRAGRGAAAEKGRAYPYASAAAERAYPSPAMEKARAYASPVAATEKQHAYTSAYASAAAEKQRAYAYSQPGPPAAEKAIMANDMAQDDDDFEAQLAAAMEQSRLEAEAEAKGKTGPVPSWQPQPPMEKQKQEKDRSKQKQKNPAYGYTNAPAHVPAGPSHAPSYTESARGSGSGYDEDQVAALMRQSALEAKIKAEQDAQAEQEEFERVCRISEMEARQRERGGGGGRFGGGYGEGSGSGSGSGGGGRGEEAWERVPALVRELPPVDPEDGDPNPPPGYTETDVGSWRN